MALGVWHMKMIDKIHDRLLVSLLSEIKKWVYFVTDKICYYWYTKRRLVIISGIAKLQMIARAWRHRNFNERWGLQGLFVIIHILTYYFFAMLNYINLRIGMCLTLMWDLCLCILLKTEHKFIPGINTLLHCCI